MLDADGPAAVAKHLVETYPTEQATVEMQAVGVALLAKADYMPRAKGGNDRSLKFDSSLYGGKQKKNNEKPEMLTKDVNALVDAILTINSPYARDVAVETLLQVFSEGMGSQHATSGNGRRKILSLPRELTGRAAEFLESEDPFTRGLAEWAVCVNVSNENDERGRAEEWPGKTKPDWWDTWAGIPESEHLRLDYIRQATSLQMHRRGEDLLTLSKDQMRRAIAKADWAKAQLSGAEAAKIDALVKQMQDAHKTFAAVVQGTPEDLTACREAFLQWRPTVRSVAMSGPDMNFDSVVYLTRFSGGAHLQPGIHDPWAARGGDLYVQEGLDPDSPRRALIGEKMPEGFLQDLDLWYDADKIVFSRTDERYVLQLYEIDLEGKQLTRVTNSEYHDADPAYLPDGGIVYGSMKAKAGTMCASALGGVGKGGASHTNIFRLNAARDEIRRLSYCKDDDCYPYVLNDGRVVWMRWDYQERGVDEIFSLWVIRPDGTGADGLYRVHIPDSEIIQALRDPKPIPDTQKLVAAGGSHRTGTEGHLIVADTSMGINNPLGIRTVTPYASPTSRGAGKLMRPVEEGGLPYIGGYCVKPTALSEKSFLAGIGFDMPQSCNFWLYYVDVWGNKELIRREMLQEIATAMPIRKRAKPPVLPDMTDQSKSYATCYVDNVYADLPGVEKGEVKYLRIAQQMFWITKVNTQGLQYHPRANASEVFGYPGTGGPVRVFGIVPVEEDGSAHFQVPAAVDVYFQALDKDYRAVQRMRTHVEFGRGENRSCIGCHETRENVAPIRNQGIALQKEAVRPTPPPWGDTTLINYETMIQPIWDAKCIKCHGEKDPKADLTLTAKRDKYGFVQSYRSMFGLKPSDPTPDVTWNVDGWVKKERIKSPKHPWWDIMYDHIIVRRSIRGQDSIVNIPKMYGAVRHPLAKKLLGEGKHGKLLTDEEKQLIMTWFDIQSPYFDTYMQNKPGRKNKGLVRVKVDPFPPFGDSREHTIHRPGEEVTQK